MPTPRPVIVLLEDDPAQSRLLQDVLTHPSINVATIGGVFASGDALLQWWDLSRPPPDLILMDLRLTGEDGYTLLPRLRQTPGLESVPVLALTANVMPHDLQRAQAAGFDGLIGKPIDPDVLPDLICAALAGRHVWKPF